MRRGIMLCYPFEEKRLSKWQPPYIVQPKLDGERCRALYSKEEESWILLSSEENVITSVPHIVEALNGSDIDRSLELDGELYCHRKPFEEIHSIVGRTTSLSIEYDSIELHLFDVIDLSKRQADRISQLYRLPLSGPIVRVPTELCHNLDQILHIFDKFVEADYEGIIVRHFANYYKRSRSTEVMKFKPKKEDIYEIVGYEQMVSITGELKPCLGSLICTSQDHGSFFSVGSGLNDEFRYKYWPQEVAETLKGKMVRVKYQHITTKKGVPRFPVFVELIEPGVEVSMVNFLPKETV